MSNYDRSGGGAYDERERYYRNDDRERGGQRGDFFSGGREDRGFFGSDRNRGRDRDDDRSGMFGGGSRSSAWDRDSRYGRDWDRDDRHFGYDDHHKGLPINETEQLIASNKVEGTPVYGREGERLGTIYNFMVDKRSGQVEYAVMSYGGFLGMGQRYYPLPWRILTYDTNEGGYRVNMDYRDMERAPSFGRNDEPRFNREYSRRVHSWYGLDY
jgi:sporulation protein YlmC with PRC-barrel domain